MNHARLAGPFALLVPLVLAACNTAPTTPPPGATAVQPAQITPVNATVKLGHITEKTYLTRVDVPVPDYGGGGTAVGVGAGGGSGGGFGGVGLSFDLTRLFSRKPTQQVDVYQYKVLAAEGMLPPVNGPAAPGLEPGACVRVIYVPGNPQPGLQPSNEC